MNDRHKRSGEDFPALRDFLRGYFHEDCIEEYGSLEGAARQFVKDADHEQRKALASEWERFMKLMGKSPLEKINEALRAMGSACEFSSLDEIQKITNTFR
jgi:CdiI immunity protein